LLSHLFFLPKDINEERMAEIYLNLVESQKPLPREELVYKEDLVTNPLSWIS